MNIEEKLKELEELVENNFNETQIFRRNKIDLNCKRHLEIFTTHKIIPKFCFNCFKVQITLDNILDLIKLYFYFNNVNLKNNNIRKCVVELRKNVSGNYKGYVFSDTLQDAKGIKEILNNEIHNEKINLNKIEIKRGCTEYYDEFELYKDINQNVSNMIYTKSKVKKCEYKEWIVKNPFYNWTREEWEKGKNDPNPLVSDMYNKVKLFYPELKRRCYTINLKKFIIENNISNQQANNFIKNKTYLLSSLERSVTRKEIGNFFLEKRYYKNYNKSAKLIKIIHPIIFIILILVIWQFRHSMTNLILKIIYKIKSEI